MKIIDRKALVAALIMANANGVLAMDADPFGGTPGRGAGGGGSHEISAEELPAYFPGGITWLNLSKDDQNAIKEKAIGYLAAEPLTSSARSLACDAVAQRLMIEYQSLGLRIDRDTILLSFTKEELANALDKAKTVKETSFPRKTIGEFKKEQQKEFLDYAMGYIRTAPKTHTKHIPYAEAARQLILQYKNIDLSISRDMLSKILQKNPEYAEEITKLKSDATTSTDSKTKQKRKHKPGAGGGGSAGAGGGGSGAAASVSAAASLDVRQAFLSSLSSGLQTIVVEFTTNPKLRKTRLDHLKSIGKAKLEALRPLLTDDMADHHYSIISDFESVSKDLMNDAVIHVRKQLKSKGSYSTIQGALAEFLAENASAESRKRARGGQ